MVKIRNLQTHIIMGEEKKKRCFIITPIGEPESEIRKKADGVIGAVVKPIVEQFGYDLVCPHEMAKNGSITQQVIEELLNDELVIANLTGLNANVMYELAIRHATKKPVITISEKSTKLPFDIATERTLFYEDNMFQVNLLRQDLEKMIKEPSNLKEIDNPIFRAKFDLEIRKSLPDNKEGKALELIINKLGLIENSIFPSKSGIPIDENIPYNIVVENCLDNSHKKYDIEISSNDTVQDILNKVYFAIEPLVEPYKYMQSWVLRESYSGLYMIMYEVTSLVPAKHIFTENRRWQIVKWSRYKINQSRYEGGI